MASWLGHATTTFTSAPETVSLPLKVNADSKDSSIALLDLIKSTTPPCRLNPLLFNAHLQTCWTALKGIDIPITYKRRVFESTSTVYPGSFAVDFVASTSNTPEAPDPDLPVRTTVYTATDFELLGSDDEKPMLILLHGLSGGSHEVYLRHVLRPLCLNVKEEDKWEACVVNSRGCAHSKITSGVLYNARSTWDMRQTVNWIKQKWPKRKLFGIGFSLGANILTNYLCEEGAECKLDAAILVSNPWDLNVSNINLQNSLLGKQVYSRVMGTSMRELFERHAEMIMKENPTIDEKKVRSLTYLHEFDRYVQCPTWGWPTEGAYYRDASSIDSIYGIQVPVLAIHAEDDPIACDVAAPYEEVKQNRNIILCSTSLGGHLSWFEVGGERWFARAAEGFLQKMVKDVDLKALREKRQPGFVNGGAIRKKKSNGSVKSSRQRKRAVYDPILKRLQDSEQNSQLIDI